MATTTTTVPAFGSSVTVEPYVVTRETTGGQINQCATTSSFLGSVLNLVHAPLTTTEKDTLFNFLVAHVGELFTVHETDTDLKWEVAAVDEINVDLLSHDDETCALWSVSYVAEGKIIGA
jgi:hypothetical protein